MRWITATNLKQWAQTRNCQENLPLLTRKLIRTTSTNISKIVFPAGDNVFISGWDGILETTDDNEYIPAGISLWEFGASKDFKTKAENDFNKRSENSLGYDKTSATFIFVTPYIWENKNECCQAKKNSTDWKDIRIYDAILFEEWIEISPPVGAWLSKEIKSLPDRVQPADDFWMEWSTGLNYKITPDLLTAGRNKEFQKIENWLDGKPSLISVQASSRNEALSFVLCVIEQLANDKKDKFYSSALIIDDKETFRQIACNKNSFILIPRFDDEGVINRAIQQGHYVIIPIGADNTYISVNQIVLPKIDREGFINALKKMGLSEEQSKKYSKESGRNITILRRQMEFERKRPEWTQNTNYIDLIPALLAGRWNEKKVGDKEIIAKLSGKSYEQYIQNLVRWKISPDFPFYQIGNRWRIVSPLDMWTHLASFITQNEFDNLKSIVFEVLSEINPAFELDSEKRYMASIYGKEFKYSSWLREGLSHSLIIIGFYGDKFNFSNSVNSQLWIDSIVRDLLKEANSNKWCSLSDVMPLLAEASPTAFMDAIEQSLKEDSHPIMGMFEETESPLSSITYHSNLLWALEGIAWLPEYLGRVSKILCNLTKLDPGGKLVNRPINSLRQIFLPWLPQTYANFDKRIEALQMLTRFDNSIAWNLLIMLLPTQGEICHPAHKMRWRNFAEQEYKITWPEIWKVHSIIIDLLISLNETDENKIEKLIEKIDDISNQDRKKIIDYIDKNSEVFNQSGYKVWNSLRKILYRHRSYPKANWALQENELIEINTLFNKLTPNQTINKYTWLFDQHWPEFSEGFNHDEIDYKEQEKMIEEKRTEALQNIYQTIDFDGILQLIDKVKNPRFIGLAASNILNKDIEIINVLDLLKQENKKTLEFASSFIFHTALRKNSDFVDVYFEKIKQLDFPKKAINSFLLALSQTQHLYDLIENSDIEIMNDYWANCYPNFYNLQQQEKIWGINKLISVGRYFTAIDEISRFVKLIPSIIIIDVLNRAATQSANEKRGLADYEITSLFEELYNRNDFDKMLLPKLEWYYISFLTSYGSNHNPKYLHNELSENPVFFLEVLSLIYKSKDDSIDEIETDENIKEQQKIRATNAWHLLRNWSKIPGSNDEGIIDNEKLKNWISKARDICQQNGRLDIADIQIGQVFSSYIPNNEQLPPDQICEIIDTINSESLSEGFFTGILNSRGTTSRGVFEGGRQERNLSKHYKEIYQKLSTKWPITASIFDKLTKYYEADAKRMDNFAEKEELEY